jgi:hypothetical protein
MSSISQRNKAKQATRAIPVLAANYGQRHIIKSQDNYIADMEFWLDQAEDSVFALELERDELKRSNAAYLWVLVVISVMCVLELVVRAVL